MSVSALSGSDAASLLRQFLASLQSSSSTSAASTDPSAPADSAAPAEASGAPPGPPPPRPDAAGSDRFSTDTLSSLMQAQEQPSASDAASKLISGSDADGSGTLSLAEITQALSGGASTAASAVSSGASSSLADAFSKLDTNGDGQLDQSEVAAGLQKMGGAHHGGHHHHHGAYAQAASATDAATSAAAATPAASTTPTAAEATDVTV